MKATQEQRKKWFLEKKCHVCGSDNEHSHPRWMWLANPVPELGENASTERLEMAKLTRALDKRLLIMIVGGQQPESVEDSVL